MLVRTFCLLCVFLVLVSCSTTRQVSLARVEISEGVFFDLLPAKVFGKKQAITQSVNISHNGEGYNFIMRMEVDSEAVKLVGLTRFGVSFFNLVWRDGQLQYDLREGIDMAFVPDYLLADIQLALWPESMVKKSLSGRPVDFTIENEMPDRRILSFRGERLIVIDYEYDADGIKRIHYSHRQRHYDIVAETLSIESL